MVRAYEDDPELDSLIGVPQFSNERKDPAYVDVHTDRLVIYPGQEVVPVTDLDEPGNAFERLLDRIEARRDKRYIVAVLRPGTSRLAGRLRMAILDRGIDYGQELFETGQTVHYRPSEEAEILPLPDPEPEPMTETDANPETDVT